MTKVKVLCSYAFLAMALWGCSLDISQAVNTPSAPEIQASLPAPLTPSSNRPPLRSRIGNPALPSTAVPVTWDNLNLDGKLVYISSVQSTNSLIFKVQALDLSDGTITTIFQAPNGAWVDFVSVSPDNTQLVMAYMPPRDDPLSASPGQQALYTMPLDGSQGPRLLLQPPSNGDQYFQPVWSPDGTYVYFSHVDFNAPPKLQGQRYGYYEIYRMRYPDGGLEKLADQAYWPRLSGDGARLAYVRLSPLDGSNQLFVANPDGSGAYQVALSGLYVPPIIDAPFFTPDDQSVLYSAVVPTQSLKPNWIERVFGIRVASAHTVPSDWWSVPIGGGTPIQLTHIAAVGLYASLSPDRNYIASYSGNGLFLMKPDGTGLTMLVGDTGGLAGSVDWVP